MSNAFDELARALATPMPRRRLLRTLGAALLVGAVPALRPTGAGARSDVGVCPGETVRCFVEIPFGTHEGGCYYPQIERCCVGPNNDPVHPNQMSWVCGKDDDCGVAGACVRRCPPGRIGPCGTTPCCAKGEECVDGVCAPPRCLQGDGEACGGKCCKPTEYCAFPEIGRCCKEGWQKCAAGKNGYCCPREKTCCFYDPLPGQPGKARTQCCERGERCLAGVCCPTDRVCRTRCCKPNEDCVGGECTCPKKRRCDGGCCPPGLHCEKDECVCPDRRTACAGACCGKDRTCIGERCCKPGRGCGGECCDGPNEECVTVVPGRATGAAPASTQAAFKACLPRCVPGSSRCGTGCCSDDTETCLGGVCAPASR